MICRVRHRALRRGVQDAVHLGSESTASVGSRNLEIVALARKPPDWSRPRETRLGPRRRRSPWRRGESSDARLASRPEPRQGRLSLRRAEPASRRGFPTVVEARVRTVRPSPDASAAAKGSRAIALPTRERAHRRVDAESLVVVELEKLHDRLVISPVTLGSRATPLEELDDGVFAFARRGPRRKAEQLAKRGGQRREREGTRVHVRRAEIRARTARTRARAGGQVYAARDVRAHQTPGAYEPQPSNFGKVHHRARRARLSRSRRSLEEEQPRRHRLLRLGDDASRGDERRLVPHERRRVRARLRRLVQRGGERSRRRARRRRQR